MEVTNEVIVERIDNLKEHFGETLKRIEAQTVKTNGRVSALEKWRSYILGGLAIISMIVVPLLIQSIGFIVNKVGS
jgi:hypothetical protein